MRYTVIIPAAGSGTRTKLSYNKLFYMLGEKTVIEHTVDVFSSDEKCGQIILSVSKSDEEKMQKIFLGNPKIQIVIGGNTRHESIEKALAHAQHNITLVHDGARPFIKQKLIDDCLAEIACGFNVIVGIPVKDTIKIVDGKVVKETPPRENLIAAQTPQGAKTNILKSAYERAKIDNFDATDDAGLLERYSDIPIKVVTGNELNIKLTSQEDLALFELMQDKRH